MSTVTFFLLGQPGPTEPKVILMTRLTLTPVLADSRAFLAAEAPDSTIEHTDYCERVSLGDACVGGCAIVAPIDFDGWVIRDSEGEYLRVVRLVGELPVIACESCESPSVYRVVVPDGGACGSCQACLVHGLDDPRSPDEFFVPAAKR